MHKPARDHPVRAFCVLAALPVRIGQHPESYGGACETAEQAASALHMVDHIRNFARR